LGSAEREESYKAREQRDRGVEGRDWASTRADEARDRAGQGQWVREAAGSAAQSRAAEVGRTAREKLPFTPSALG